MLPRSKKRTKKWKEDKLRELDKFNELILPAGFIAVNLNE